MQHKVIKEQQKIGSFIAELRELKGFTQKSFARELKTSQSAVARMEGGLQNFSTEMLAKISQVLKREIITLADKSVSFKIEGKHKLAGEAVTKSSKNAAVALLCASLLNNGKTTLKNVPKIEEVFRVIEVLVSIGVLVKWQGADVEIVPPKKLNLAKINKEAAAKTRSVLMLLGPLAHLFKQFNLPLAGGCKLGRRTVRPHLYALENFGVKIKTTHDHYEVAVATLKTAQEITLYETGDTVTENTVMAASKISGITTVKLASANYMVQDLCHFLTKLGIKIEGIGSSTLVIHGKGQIKKNVSFSISEDPIESMLFLSLAATTNSSITIKRCPIDFLRLELLKLEKMGLKYKVLRHYKSDNKFTNLADIKTFESSLVALEEKIHPLPYPGLNIDNLPFFVPIATRAKGTTLIHDWVYENRAIYYMELNKLRANIILADPHRVYIEGPSELRGSEVICPPALRPAAIILIAMLAAKGTSILRNVYSINRGYEDLVRRLQKLGAKIEITYRF
ncbi:MAG: UDP-N-acetylglucosamine 1-carboxyvinyltransferase [Candidatus Doudnabacteria bacterium CG10_big_fil_rev_8_21_14_0_10_42_18]|uniref:UDP-N-acetylglucosamine 1-carboxyvinyltransferase n=1 Tax=Candidatus Doudnabacteria bacterium CG10_big_fil_rev_8_21_14_0_10_42_18 TaxID=1974552 RepID=A0A2H0VBW3_9BACT|nr:MAG: UDP-N-acetylglucosamine 1-carboxyvinyltransferase [Candidatus Doudnabacteria bacterium CG10_big_fil_rev_8_21_14_0_10_42_18]